MLKIWRFLLLIALLSGCRYPRTITQLGVVIIDKGYTTVVGLAEEDSKGGALIEGKRNRYFIKGLRSWPKDIYGKKVKARGKCITYDQQQLLKDLPTRQGYPVQNVLQDVTWEVIEN